QKLSQTTSLERTGLQRLALKCSYQVALRIAQKKQPYTLGEDSILPSATDMCKTMYGNDIDINKLKTVPLSDTTIARRIDEMASDVRVQLIEKLRLADAFALQLDESTDVSKDTQLLAFVRFVDQNEMQEEFLFPERTTSAEIFKVIDAFFRENYISWAKCVALCTDGARAMAGLKSGLIALVRDSLVAKDMSAELSDVMDSVVKVVNIVKKSALQTRLFSNLCAAEGEEHTRLLYHSEVRWLSRGTVLARVLELRTSFREFLLLQKRTELAALFSDNVWITKLAYLADIFAKLNKLCSSMQGRNTHAFQLFDRMEGFVKKIRKWKEFCGALASRNTLAHLEALHGQFRNYFSEADNAADGARLAVTEEDQLIELSTDSTYRNIYETKPLTQFWISCQKDFPQLAAKAMMSLLSFATTYLCESGFSSLTYLKNKYRSRLQPEADMTLCLTTSIRPRLDKLCATHQGQTSH
uniref:HAT C-terminal dimerisation domain-containing protein n=1 Tax=Dicentrarchus labrax TaxID=13489 RepID=A0A8C4ESG1_DICLA